MNTDDIRAFVKEHYVDIDSCELFTSVRTEFEYDILNMDVMLEGKKNNSKWYLSFLDQLNKLKKWYKIKSEFDVEVNRMRKTDIPRCWHCHKDFVKVESASGKYHFQWKPACSCVKKDIRICVG